MERRRGWGGLDQQSDTDRGESEKHSGGDRGHISPSALQWTLIAN